MINFLSIFYNTGNTSSISIYTLFSIYSYNRVNQKELKNLVFKFKIITNLFSNNFEIWDIF